MKNKKFYKIKHILIFNITVHIRQKTGHKLHWLGWERERDKQLIVSISQFLPDTLIQVIQMLNIY